MKKKYVLFPTQNPLLFSQNNLKCAYYSTHSNINENTTKNIFIVKCIKIKYRCKMTVMYDQRNNKYCVQVKKITSSLSISIIFILSFSTSFFTTFFPIGQS